MNNGTLWDLVNIIIRKEKEGSSVTPEQLSSLLMWANEEFKLLIYRKYEQDQEETDSIRVIKKSEEISVDSEGLFDLAELSETYWHHSSAFYFIQPLINYDRANIDVVTDKEYAKRMSSSLLLPTAYCPIMVYINDHILFEPLRSVDVQYSYLRLPVTPVYDYVKDSNDNIIYLQSTWSVVSSGGQYNVKNALNGAGNTIYTNVTHLTASSYPYNSCSVELEWNNEDKIYVLYLMLQKLGVNLELAAVMQYGMIKEAEKKA